MIKRLFDICVVLAALPLLLPVLALVASAVALVMGRPVLFRQMRPGLHAQPFLMYKFRSMLNRTDAQDKPLPDAERLTSFGKLLRASSLDELPALWNVLRGDMSLVGPRPLLMEYLPLYTAEQARRHEVRPGITGWAQINGRNALDWESRFEHDVWYVDHRSMLLDLKILLLTIRKIFDREGITSEGEATMTPFAGTRSEKRPR